MKRNLIKRAELNTAGADFFEYEVTGYMETRGEYWLNDDDLDEAGHPFTLTVETGGAWIDFNDNAVGLCEERAERALTGLLAGQIKELRDVLEDRNAY